MAYEQKPGQGSLFKNESDNEKAPIYKGKLMTPNGELLNIALWLRTSQSGVKYFYINAQSAEQQASDQAQPQPVTSTYQTQPQPQQRPVATQKHDNDLPF